MTHGNNSMGLDSAFDHETQINVAEVVNPVNEDDLTDYYEDTWSNSVEEVMGPRNDNLTDEQRIKLSEVISKNTFAFTLEDLNKPCSHRKFKIEVSCDKPIRSAPYRVPESEKYFLKTEIQSMLRNNIIRPSRSPWASPVLIVPKKNGSKRLCTDFRNVNKITIKHNFPLPRCEEILERLRGAKYFSSLDLKSGYWQIELDEDSIKYTAFITPYGVYESRRVLFGLINAPYFFCEIMNEILGDLSFVVVYMDDIFIFSNTFEEHLDHIAVVIERLNEVNLKINGSKCDWCKPELKILGHLVG